MPGVSTVRELQHRLLVPTAHSLQGHDMSSEIDLTPRQRNSVLSCETDGRTLGHARHASGTTDVTQAGPVRRSDLFWGVRDRCCLRVLPAFDFTALR